MENKSKRNPMKNFTKIISDSSQRFLASFLDDSLAQKKEKEKKKTLIRQAISQNNMVVLQIVLEDHPNGPFETLYGKVRENKNNSDVVVLVSKDTNEIKMIPMDQIKKVSIMGHSHKKMAK
ncbi:hypothetical protein ACWN8V_04185 [Vagococcus elongatus]|uniref:Uncharacterized protein n=1 Tax=Vagococcus elongatus TaxID=180344 RepID=A0A430AYF1_9ENTE|nr:hypothetical protein [Vagococcus elongatus]RSU13093.1 hypothetical protein CBF29_05335 [Vagococcus elongatus]